MGFVTQGDITRALLLQKLGQLGQSTAQDHEKFQANYGALFMRHLHLRRLFPRRVAVSFGGGGSGFCCGWRGEFPWAQCSKAAWPAGVNSPIINLGTNEALHFESNGCYQKSHSNKKTYYILSFDIIYIYQSTNCHLKR